MRKKVWILMLFIAVSIAFVFLLSYPQSLPSDIELGSTALPTTPIRATQNTDQLSKATLSANKQTSEDDFNPYEDEVFKAQLLQVADLYEETLRYPVNSQPIRNPETAREPTPFEETEVDTPYPSEDGAPTIRLQAAVEKPQYFKGERVKVRLSVVGAPADVFVKAVAIISGVHGDTPLSGELNASDETRTSFSGEFDLQAVPAQLLFSEMLLKILVTVDEQQLFTTVGFGYAVASATLVGVPYQRQEGAYLNIPLHNTV